MEKSKENKFAEQSKRGVLKRKAGNADSSNKSDNKNIRIYIDGVFDLFHFGHARLFERTKKRFPGSKIVVGICNDELVNKYKGKTVLNSEERVESVEHCKWVDEVISDAPWVVDQEFLEKHKIDFVAHDPEPYAFGDTDDIYAYVKSKNMFIATERTDGISTSEIINRVVKDYDEFVRRNLNKGYSRKEMNVGFLKEKRIKVVGKMGEMRDRVDQLRNRVKDKGDEVLDNSKVFIEKWYENSQKYIDEFLQLFGRDGRIVFIKIWLIIEFFAKN